MADLHITLRSPAPTVRWDDDDSDFDPDLLEQAMVEARRREYAQLAALDAA